MIEIFIQDPETVIIRLLTVSLYLIAFYRMCMLTTERWSKMTRFGKRLWIGHIPTLFAVVWFMIEALETNLRLQIESFGFLVAGAFLAASTFFRFNNDESTKPVYLFHLRERNPLKWRIQKLR